MSAMSARSARNEDFRERVSASVASRVAGIYGDRVVIENHRFDEYPTIIETRFVPRAASAAWVSILLEDFEHVFSVAGYEREHTGSISEDETIDWMLARVCEIADQGLVRVRGAMRLTSTCSTSDLSKAEQVWRPW